MKSVKVSFLATIAVSITLALFSSPSLSAHSALVATNPVANSTIDVMPPVIEITFNEAPLELKSGDANYIKVVDPDGIQLSFETSIQERTLTSPVSASSKQDNKFINGEYSVEYRFVSPDGHVIESTFTFNLSTTAANNPTDKSSTEESDGSDAAHFDLAGLLAIGGGALLLALMAIWFVTARRKR